MRIGPFTLVACCWLNTLVAHAAEVALLEATETAGIRRRNDVVSARLVFPKPLPRETKFCLRQDGKTVDCQFRPVKTDHQQVKAVDLDFIAHFQPLESRQYEVRYGENIAPGKEPAAGLQLVETGTDFRISNRDLLQWTVRKDLRSLFRFSRKPDVEFVKPGGAGLAFQTRGGERHELSEKKPSRSQVLRQGPLACAIQFDYANWPIGASSSVVMEFVRTKSWVRTTWTVSGPIDLALMNAELLLDLVGKETLIDFSAGDFVYTTVRADQVAEMAASPTPAQGDRWAIRRGRPGSLEPLVVGTPSHPRADLGGWVHVMDETRCTAGAMSNFAEATHDRIEVGGSGRLLFERRWNAVAERHSLEFWVHFVGVPVHLGARTSPQSMRSPLVVRWLSTSGTPST